MYIWPCLFCICQAEYAYPAHHGNFWDGDLPGAGWAWLGKLGTEKWDFRKIEIGLGRHFWHPYAIELSVSVRIDLGTPHGCVEPRTESFGNVGFLTETWGGVFFVFREIGLGLMGGVRGGGGVEPVWNGANLGCGPIRMPPGPLGAPIGPPGPFPHFPQFPGFGPGPFPGKFPWCAL